MWNCSWFCATRIMCHLGGKLRLSDSVQINLNCLQKSDRKKCRLDCAVTRLLQPLGFWLPFKACHLKTYASSERTSDFISLSHKQTKFHLNHLRHCPFHSRFCEVLCTWWAISWCRWMRLGTADFRNGVCMLAFLETGRSFRDGSSSAKTYMFQAISKFGSAF